VIEPSGPPPEVALVYTVGNDPQSVVVMDATTSKPYRQAPLPDDVYLQQLRPDGEVLYFLPVDGPGDNRIDLGEPHTLFGFNVLTGNRREIITIDRYVAFGFALSPDGTKLAYSVRVAEPNSGVPDIQIRVLNLNTMDDRAVGTFGAEPFEQFSGTATVRVWRDDGWLSIVGAKQGGQPRGVALISTETGEKRFGEPGFGIASGRGKWIVHTDTNGVGSVVHDPQRIRVVDPLTNQEVNRLEDPERCSWYMEWSPDDSELLIRQHRRLPARDGANECDVERPAHVLLPADGSPARPANDLHDLWTEWFGERLVEVRCPHEQVVHRERDCVGNLLVVHGREVAAGDFIRVLGWIEP
jgi:hypothetical protein